MLLGEEGLAAPHAPMGMLSTLMATLLSLLAGPFPAPASASDAESVQPQGLLHAALDWSCRGVCPLASPAHYSQLRCADLYMDKMKRLPVPHKLAKVWPDFASLFNFLRPHTAVVRLRTGCSCWCKLTFCGSCATNRYSSLHLQPIPIIVFMLIRLCCLLPQCSLLSQGIAAALVHRVFAMFLDRASSVELDDHTCQVTLQLVVAMSKSYMNTTTSAATDITKEFFGAGNMGENRGTEKNRAQV